MASSNSVHLEPSPFIRHCRALDMSFAEFERCFILSHTRARSAGISIAWWRINSRPGQSAPQVDARAGAPVEGATGPVRRRRAHRPAMRNPA